MPSHLHRCSAHEPTEHPCTLAVPHLHYPTWLRVIVEQGDTSGAMMVWLWWPQRRPRQGVRLLRTRPRAAA